MRWDEMRSSTNVEDRRSAGGGRPRLAIGGGIGSIVILLIYMLLGGNPLSLLQSGGGNAVGPALDSSGPAQPVSANDEQGQFVSHVLGDTEDVWTELFRKIGRQYREPRLILFNGGTQSGCGFGDAATGPFYCPADQRVYIDLSFYRELSNRFGAPGDFAQAYVIAHEVGHHVQKLLGISDRVDSQRRRMSEAEANALSVRVELQADYFAGVWAHHARDRKLLEQGDVEEALRAAAAIGDDRLQKQSRGYVVPESFTHGSSDQRVRWFRKGLDSGDPAAGDTFSVSAP